MPANTMSILYYIHDPMCSWCWAFRPVLSDLKQALPPTIEFRQLLGGLAPDTDQPMPEAMQQQLQETWRRIQLKLPETRFNFDFWRDNKPRRATYPACRAVIAARLMRPDSEEAMILAIQQAYYLQARNPSDERILIQLAEACGLDGAEFARRLNGEEAHAMLQREMEQTKAMGVRSFPSLVLQHGTSGWPIGVDYQSIDPMLENLQMALD